MWVSFLGPYITDEVGVGPGVTVWHLTLSDEVDHICAFHSTFTLREFMCNCLGPGGMDSWIGMVEQVAVLKGSACIGTY